MILNDIREEWVNLLSQVQWTMCANHAIFRKDSQTWLIQASKNIGHAFYVESSFLIFGQFEEFEDGMCAYIATRNNWTGSPSVPHNRQLRYSVGEKMSPKWGDPDQQEFWTFSHHGMDYLETWQVHGGGLVVWHEGKFVKKGDAKVKFFACWTQMLWASNFCDNKSCNPIQSIIWHVQWQNITTWSETQYSSKLHQN